MLTYLTIDNVAIIEHSEIEFFEGLNVMTGETGAGKSIIIDSIGMSLGHRIGKDLIRSGAAKASVTAVFFLTDEVWQKFEEYGIEKSEDNTLVLYREIAENGRSLCKINGMPVPVSTLKSIGIYLINIHGQQDTAVLYSPDKHMELLDRWSGEELERAKAEYADIFTEYTRLKKEYERLEEASKNRERETDLLSFQINELSVLNLQPDETSRLEERLGILRNSEKISDALTSAYNTMMMQTGSVSDLLRIAQADIKSVSSYSDDIAQMYENLTDITYRADDIAAEIRIIQESTEYSENELSEVEARLYEIKKLCKKYRCEPDGLIDFLSDAQERLERLNNAEVQLADIKQQLEQESKKISTQGNKLHEIRLKSAKLLEAELETQLAELNMKGSKFKVMVEKTQKFDENGNDNVEFFISPNVGEEPKPIAKIASGGELSRIMLAIKSIISEYDLVGTYIFDEIDTGISGKTAERVADKLILVARKNQTIIVTHSPHIAAIADHHYLIEKNVENNKTKTHLVLLDKQGRINEIARINSGSHISEAALAHASELLAARRTDM